MSTAAHGVSFADLAAYTEYLAARWFAYFEQNPGALDVNIGGRTGTIRELVRHIALAEMFLYARLTGGPRPPAPDTPPTLDELRTLHAEARKKTLEYLSRASESDLQEKVPFIQEKQVSRRKVLAQVFLHAIHHWAQIAIEVRQAGFPPTTPQDIIMSDAME